MELMFIKYPVWVNLINCIIDRDLELREVLRGPQNSELKLSHMYDKHEIVKNRVPSSEFRIPNSTYHLMWEKTLVPKASHDPLTLTSFNSKVRSITQLIKLTHAGYSINVSPICNKCHFSIRTMWDLQWRFLKQSLPKQSPFLKQ